MVLIDMTLSHLTTEFDLYAVATEMIQVTDCTVQGILVANYRNLDSPLTMQPIVCLDLYVTFTHRALICHICGQHSTPTPSHQIWWEGGGQTLNASQILQPTYTVIK